MQTSIGAEQRWRGTRKTSPVYAEKLDEVIFIYCDTKITHGQKGGALFSPQMQELVDRYGIVKTTIIWPEVAISLAANVSKAASLFRALDEKKSFSTEEVLEIAKNISDSVIRGDTDYIIESCEDGQVRLGCVKNGHSVADCQNVWIGSRVAHNEFPKERDANVIFEEKGVSRSRSLPIPKY